MKPSSTISADAGTCRSCVRHLTISVRAPRSRPANWYSDSVSGTGVTAPRIVAGSAPSATAIGNGSPGMRERVIAKVERAAAVREPAHDHLVAARSPAGGRCRGSAALLCGPRVTVRPHVISGPASPGQQVWTGRRARSTSLPSHTISWHGADDRSFGAMSQHLHEHRARVLPRVLQALAAARAPSGTRAACRFRAAPSTDRPRAHRPARRAAACRTDCRAPGCVWPFGFSNSSAGPPALQHAVADLGHLEPRIDFDGDALEFAARSSCARKSRRSAYFMIGCSGALARS